MGGLGYTMGPPSRSKWGSTKGATEVPQKLKTPKRVLDMSFREHRRNHLEHTSIPETPQCAVVYTISKMMPIFQSMII